MIILSFINGDHNRWINDADLKYEYAYFTKDKVRGKQIKNFGSKIIKCFAVPICLIVAHRLESLDKPLFRGYEANMAKSCLHNGTYYESIRSKFVYASQLKYLCENDIQAKFTKRNHLIIPQNYDTPVVPLFATLFRGTFVLPHYHIFNTQLDLKKFQPGNAYPSHAFVELLFWF